MHDSNDVGLIGLGLLGAALAERLLRAGRAVRGFDLNPDRCDELARLGGRPVASAIDLAELPRLVLCLPDSTIVATVVAVLESRLRPGQLVVDTSTGLPADAVRLAESLRGRGVSFGEATLLGSSEAVRQGEGVVMAGGDAAWLEGCRDLLDAFAPRLFHVGPAGSGARMKLVVNLVLGLHRAVLAEGLTLAEAYGLDLDRTLEVLRFGAAASRVMDAKGRKMIDRDYRPQAKLAQHLKDVRIILNEAERLGAPTPLSAVHRGLLEEVERYGLGEADNAAIREAFRIVPGENSTPGRPVNRA